MGIYQKRPSNKRDLQGLAIKVEEGRLMNLEAALGAKFDWFRQVMASDKHFLIVGPTGAGKSMLCSALAVMMSNYHNVAIFDPHAAPQEWGGIEAIGLGRNYVAISEGFELIRRELDTRFAMRARGIVDFPVLHVFIDEYPAIVSNVEGAAEFVVMIAQEGRKVNIRLRVLAQSYLVKALGLEGRGQTRDNFDFIYLGNFALERRPELASLKYPALWEHNNILQVIATSFLPRLQARPGNLVNCWKVAPSYDKVTQVLSSQVPASSNTAPQNLELNVKVAIWLKMGFSKTEIVERIGGNRQAAFERVNMVAEYIRQLEELEHDRKAKSA